MTETGYTSNGVPRSRGLTTVTAIHQSEQRRLKVIEKLECTCIEAYTTRKMRDPNCCACSCDHNDLVDQLAKANERVVELEKERDHNQRMYNSLLGDLSAGYGELSISECEKHLNKFAIEKKIEAINEALDYYEELKASEEPIGSGSILHVCLGRLISQQKQLRKEQE